MEVSKGELIQGMPLGRGDATTPYTVVPGDSIVEFTEAGTATTTFGDGRSATTTTVLAGSRYAIGQGTATIAFAGTFSIG